MKKNPDAIRLVDLYLVGERNLEAKYISEWKKHVLNDNVETAIIFIGSGCSEQQQCPDFAKRLGKTAILNIDPQFKFKKSLGY